MVTDISIIIVSYNTKELLRNCINSIYANIRDLHVEIIVIDNNSSDGTPEMIRGVFSDVILLQNKENIGFASANNQGIKITKGKYILLLNPDTVVIDNAINTIYGFLEKKIDVGIVGCSILRADGSLQSTTGRFPNFFRTFTQSISLDKLIFRLPGLNNCTINIPASRRDREVDWATGACLMIRRQVIDEIGVLDGNYFLYFEEVDFCHRAKEAGWKVYFVSEAKIIHYLAQSTKQDFGKTILEFYKSNYYYFHKHFSETKLFLLRWIINIGIIFRSLIWNAVRLIFFGRRKEALERLSAYREALLIRVGTRIAIDITPLTSKAGVGHYTSNLVKNLFRTNGKNTYIFLGYDKYFRGRDAFILNKVYYFIRYLFWQYFFLPLNLFMREVDILHSTAYEVPLAMPSRSVVTIHDMAFWLFPDKFTKFYQLRLKRLVPLVAKKAELIITDSEYSKKDISRLLNIKLEKIEVIYLGVDHSIFRPIENQASLKEIRSQYRIGESHFILYVGTLEPRKNIVNLIKAYYRLKTTYNLNFKLVIVGMRGWLYDEIFKVIARLGLADDIIFTDYIPDEKLPFLYNAADLFVYPSLYEGFGLPVLEAMACGIPVVTSNTSSLPELVLDCAITVNPYDIEGLSIAMYDILINHDLKNKLVEKGLLRAKDFSWEKTAEKTVEVYDKILKKR